MSRRDFGRYKIAEELGRGAMGVVYRATDPLLGRSVAVKAINHAYLESLGVAAAEYSVRFRREAEVAGRLSHPHIVKVFDLGPDYLVMELVEGQTLQALLRARVHFTLSRILEMVAQLAGALDAAHAQGVVHRDIKPGNIMVRSDGTVTVTDFGLARIESSTLTAAGEILGTASYMAPEVVRGGAADTRSDIFSLGVVSYELMTGERPFAGPSITSILYKIVHEPPPSAHGVDLNVPPGYDDIFAKVLAKEAAARYPTAGAFADDLALKRWADRDPLLAGPAPAEAVAAPVKGTGETPSPLEELVPSVSIQTQEREAGEPTAATFVMQAPEETAAVGEVSASEPAAVTFIMQGPGSGGLVSAPTPTSAPNLPAASPALGEITAELPIPEVPSRRPARVQLSGQATWGPESRHPKAAERTAKVQAGRVPTEAMPLPTLVLVPAQDRAEATLVVPPPQPAPEGDTTLVVAPAGPLAPGPDDTGPLGVVLPPIPPRGPVPPPAPGPDDTGPLGPATAPLPVERPRPPSHRRLPTSLLLGGVAGVLLLGGATVAGLAYFFLRAPAAGIETSPTGSGPRASADTGDMPPPAAEVRESAPPAEAPPVTTTEAQPAPNEQTAPVAIETPAPTPEPSLAAREPATLVVVSRPSGARVMVGGQSGTTPSRLTIPPGRVTLEVQKDGFRAWRKRLMLSAGRTLKVTAQLRPAASSRSVTPSAAVKTGDLVPLAADVTAPRRLSGESPDFPDLAKRQKMSGSVLVEFVVAEHGEVREPKILESAGEVLDRAALDAVSRWRYQPAEKAGVKVRVRQQARFTFK